MDLTTWQNNWDQLGKDDPLWAILTDSSKSGGRWNPDEFFKTGVDEIRGVFADLERLNLKLNCGRALDFGCGVGRLSQALAAQFLEVQGVDIAPSMVNHANRFNRYPGKCTYHINSEDSLPMFPPDHFDFIYSNITLHHIEPCYAKDYIREFIRVLKPGGIAVFQLLKPSFWRGLVPHFAVETGRKLKFGDKPFIGMFGMSDREVSKVLNKAGATILHLESSTGDNTTRWLNRRYFVTKPLVSTR